MRFPLHSAEKSSSEYNLSPCPASTCLFSQALWYYSPIIQHLRPSLRFPITHTTHLLYVSEKDHSSKVTWRLFNKDICVFFCIRSHFAACQPGPQSSVRRTERDTDGPTERAQMTARQKQTQIDSIYYVWLEH